MFSTRSSSSNSGSDGKKDALMLVFLIDGMLGGR